MDSATKCEEKSWRNFRSRSIRRGWPNFPPPVISKINLERDGMRELTNSSAPLPLPCSRSNRLSNRSPAFREFLSGVKRLKRGKRGWIKDHVINTRTLVSLKRVLPHFSNDCNVRLEMKEKSANRYLGRIRYLK